jgi:hypothetical protein
MPDVVLEVDADANAAERDRSEQVAASASPSRVAALKTFVAVINKRCKGRASGKIIVEPGAEFGHVRLSACGRPNEAEGPVPCATTGGVGTDCCDPRYALMQSPRWQILPGPQTSAANPQ